jgi:DNA-binding MarR family transcriptional regulator
MEFEEILVQINEILHKAIQKYKEEIIGNSRYSDLTLSQLYYLEAIATMDNPSLSNLAKRLKISNASASVGVRKLIKNGFIEKAQSSDDKRSFHLLLSSKGRSLMEAEKRAYSEFAANIKKSLSDTEIKEAEGIFKKIIQQYG